MVAMLLAMGIIAIPRPVSATADFTVTANPTKVAIPLGYWGDVILIVTSLNGLEGSVEVNVPVGGATGLSGAGLSTGMMLNARGNVSTVIMLTPGDAAGNYSVRVNVTVGSISHSLSIPITISPVSSPDFITRLWGSYSILQGWNSPVQEEITSLGGFDGQVNLTARVTPRIPDAPVVSFQPPVVAVSANHASSYTATLSAARTTPTGNYDVMVCATSGTISHLYNAVLMVGDYRPSPDDTPPGNVTTTVSTSPPTAGSPNSQLSPGSGLSTATDVLRSLWWLEMAGGGGGGGGGGSSSSPFS